MIQKNKKKGIEFRKAAKNSPEYGKLRRLYEASFPREEKAPFFYLMRRAEQPCADFLAIYADGSFAGLMYLIHPAKRPDPVYIFYFAVCPELRGQGIGQAALEALRQYYPESRIFLALEQLDESAPNIEQRRRRHSFYERCGFCDLPWNVNEGRVVYATMGTGSILPEEYNSMMARYLTWPWTWIVRTRMFPKDPDEQATRRRPEP